MTPARDIFESVIVPAFEASDQRQYLYAARSVAQQISARLGYVTVDQVRAVVPVPEDIEPRILGAVFYPRKEWQHSRAINSHRRACHGRPIGVWTYIGKAA